MYSIVEGRDFALKGGRPGFRTSDGKWIPIDTQKFDKNELDRLTSDYVRRRGSAQIEKDKAVHKAEKAKQDAARSKSSAPPAAPSQTSPAAPKPPAAPKSSTPTAKPKPSTTTPKPVVKQTGNKEKDLATWAAANPKLAAKVVSSGERTGTQRGTGQSQMSKDAEELRTMRSASIMRQNNMSLPLAKNPTSADIKKSQSIASMVSAQKQRETSENLPKTVKKMKEQYEAYDLVMEYLLAYGHADNITEAYYIMDEMTDKQLYSMASNLEWKD
jgi:hypothetical protein